MVKKRKRGIYTSSSRMAKLLGVNLTTVYRRKTITRRFNNDTGRFEFLVPKCHEDKFNELFKDEK